jgi:hypothetical protein
MDKSPEFMELRSQDCLYLKPSMKDQIPSSAAFHYSANERSDWELNISTGVSRQQFKLTKSVFHFQFDHLFLGSISFTLE